MKCWDLNLFIRDLTDFVKLVEDLEVPIDCSQLHILIGQLQSSNAFCVDIKDVAITISKKISNTQPEDISSAAIYFSHKFNFNSAIDFSKNDPVTDYKFFFQINGYGSSGKEYIYCWRLDQNLKSAPPKFTHPYYHFQAGGDELLGFETGDLILMSAPRIPHPPMDIFLGLHFILNNYLSTKDYTSVKNLFEHYDYQQIIKRAQERMWKTYFRSFQLPNSHSDYTFKNVFPLYLH